MRNGGVCSEAIVFVQGDDRNGVAASVDRAVKDALMSVLRCKAPQALPWQRKVWISASALLLSPGSRELIIFEIKPCLNRLLKRSWPFFISSACWM